jgi:membrane associated rhomboid family serine protease
MSVADRDYMREGRPWRLPSVSAGLMIILVIAFAIQCINDVYLKTFVEDHLALTRDALKRGFVWQLLTFQFLHGDLWHLVGNLLGLWFFGRPVEHFLGKSRYLIAYFGSGIAGGLLQVALMVLFPRHFGMFVYGASAGVMGVFAIFALLASHAEIRWNFIFPIRADVLLWITAAISLFFTLVPSPRGGGVAHAAHLGGIIAGWAFVRLKWHQDFRPLPWVEWFERFKNRPRRSRPIVKVRFPKGNSWEPDTATARPNEDPDFMSKEVDPILEKISAHGIHSLTEREKEILEKARSRMGKM